MARTRLGALPGFSDTADFFAARAKKAKSGDKRQDLFETARFYRALATIVPTFPPKYRGPKPSTDPWHDRAEICRALAEAVDNPEIGRRLLALAGTYERSPPKKE